MKTLREKFNNFVREKGNAFSQKINKNLHLGDYLTQEVQPRNVATLGLVTLVPAIFGGCSTTPKSRLDEAFLNYTESSEALVEEYNERVDTKTDVAIGKITKRLETYGVDQKAAFEKKYDTEYTTFQKLIEGAHEKRSEVTESVNNMLDALNDFETNASSRRKSSRKRKSSRPFGLPEMDFSYVFKKSEDVRANGIGFEYSSPLTDDGLLRWYTALGFDRIDFGESGLNFETEMKSTGLEVEGGFTYGNKFYLGLGAGLRQEWNKGFIRNGSDILNINESETMPMIKGKFGMRLGNYFKLEVNPVIYDGNKDEPAYNVQLKFTIPLGSKPRNHSSRRRRR